MYKGILYLYFRLVEIGGGDGLVSCFKFLLMFNFDIDFVVKLIVFIVVFESLFLDLRNVIIIIS